MDHVAIMKKSWGLTEKILNGEKVIESRWYLSKRAPWNKINSDDTIYFKDSGSLITLKAKVDHFLCFSNLTPIKVQEILLQYGKDDGILDKDFNKFYEIFKNRKYCILIFLKEITKIEPFNINKSGFGAMSAWITVNDINSIKI